MDDAKSFLFDVMQSLRERLGNPFVSSFLIAWPLWNFRLLLVVIGSSKEGENSWVEKIKYIDERLMPNWWHWPIHGFLVPALFALAWIFVLPPFLQFVRRWHERNVNAAERELHALSDRRTLTKEQANEMRAVFVKQRAEWANERFDVLKSLDDLVKANEQYEHQERAHKQEIQELKLQVEKLSTPPPLQPPPISSLAPDDRAKQLGVSFDSATAVAKTLFNGKPIHWPWKVIVGNSGLPPGFDGMTLPEDVVRAMFHLSTQNTNAESWNQHFEKLGFDSPGQVLNYLKQLGLFNIKGGLYEPNMHGVAMLRRLGELGFTIS